MDGVEAPWRGERRGRLLDAAVRVFSRVSYEQASMDEIAAEAEIGKPTVYRYFDSKAALFAAVFTYALDQLEARLEAVLASEPDQERRLRKVVAELIPTFRDHLVTRGVLSEDAAAIDQSKRRIFRERRDRLAGFVERAIGQAAPGIDPLKIAHLVVGMIWSGTAAPIGSHDDEIAGEIAALVLHGVSRPRAASRPQGRSDVINGDGHAPSPNEQQEAGVIRSRGVSPS